jgi:hypothetical protein
MKVRRWEGKMVRMKVKKYISSRSGATESGGEEREKNRRGRD